MTPVSSCPTVEDMDISAPGEITKYTSLNGGPYAEVDTSLNTYGLVTQKNEYDFGATTPTRETSTSYANIGGGVQDRPSVVSVTDGSGNFISKTTYTYDQDVNSLKASGASELFPPTCSSGTCRGNLTTLNTYTTSTTYLTKTFTHWDTGQVYQATDVNSAQTTFTYGDCGNSFLTSVSEPLGLSKSFTWNCTGGVTASATDENDKTSYTNYTTDEYFWRPNSTQDAFGYVTSLTYTGATQAEAVLPIVSGTSSVDVLTTLDSQGRSYITQRREAPGSSSFDTNTQYYDTDGRPYEVTMPCVKTTGTPCSTTPSTKTTYDGAGRPSLVTDGGGGTVTMAYSQNDVLRTVGPAPSGEHVKSRQTQYDGLGRTTSVCEILSSGGASCGQTASASGYLTSYAYSALTTGVGTQTVVTQSAQTRTYVNDGLGRLTSEANPESQSQPKTYIYDSVGANYCLPNTAAYSSPGDLVATSDPIGNHVCYFYDALHRLTDVTNNVPSSANFCKRFRYDNVSNGVSTQPSGSTINAVEGRMVEAETDSCTSPGSTLITDEWFSYDADARQTDIWESVVPNSWYHSVATFFANGKVNTIQLANPSYYTMTYTVDGEGRWNTLTDTTAAQNIVTGTTYFPASNPAVVSLTGSDNDAYTFDTNTGRMSKYVFTAGSSTTYTLTGILNWNADWTLGSLATTDTFDSGGTMTCNSSYDDLARLGMYDCGSGNWGQDYTYDAYGNLTKTVISGRTGTNWIPGYSSTTNQCLSCTYDADGDMTSDGSGISFWGWNVYNKNSWYNTSNSATCGTSGDCLVYDAFGRIVKMSWGAVWEDVWMTQLGPSVVASDADLDYARFPAPGGGIAVVYGNSSGVNFLHTDWLGNARIMSSVVNDTEYTDQAFTPFGERFAAYGEAYTWYQAFAGLTDDFNNGIQWEAQNREFSTEGRWLSPDPAGLAAVDPGNPQTWNRYAYVAGNALSSVDPTGLRTTCPYGPDGSGGSNCQGSYEGHGACDDVDGPCNLTPGAPQSMNNDPLQLLSQPCDEQCRYRSCLSYNFQCDANGNYVPPKSAYTITVSCGGTFSVIGCAAPSQAAAGPGSISIYTSLGMQYGLNLLAQYQADPMSSFGKDVVQQLSQMSGSARAFIIVGYAGSVISAAGGAVAADLAAGPEQSVLFGRFTRINGGFPGYLNSNSWLRIGYGWDGTKVVFRVTGNLLGGAHLDWPW
jgi:RHS repeat-associated protein